MKNDRNENQGIKRESPCRFHFFDLPALIALAVFLTGVFVETPVALSETVQRAWSAQYNGPGNSGDEAYAIAVDGSGNVYVTGASVGANGYTQDYATIKYNAVGQQQWVARYNGPGSSDDIPSAIAVDHSGNVHVTGKSVGSDYNYDYATVKYNAAGQQQWVARYNGPGNGDDHANAIAVDGLGNVYVTGASTGAARDTDYATIKYNSTGQQQWLVRYNGPALGDDEAYGIAIDNLANAYVTGKSISYNNSTYNNDYTTIKYNSAGQTQWVARYYGSGNYYDTARAIAVDHSGYVYVTGESYSSRGYDYATIKYNAVGQQQWMASYNGPGNGNDLATAIAADGLGNVYVTGSSPGVSTYDDYATIKYNSAGQEQWVARYNGPGNYNDDASAIAVDGSGNVYVTGSSWGASSYADYATIKYNLTGQRQWVARSTSQGYNTDTASALVVDGSGNVYVTGASGENSDYVTIKYVTVSSSPVATTKSATLVGSLAATLNGSLDPNGLTTTVYFQYGTTTGYGHTTASQSQTGDTSRNISANIGGLTGNTTYHFRIVATNAGGTTYGADRTFTTLSATGAPVVITNPATNVTNSSAILNGTVNPHGLSTTVYLQFGRTTNYGSRTPNQTKTGNNYQNVFANISGLSAHTTYHFRIVATNSVGTRYGSDRTFTTQ